MGVGPGVFILCYPDVRGASTLREVLIVLPPSETKAPGGLGPALDLQSLSFPSLTKVREAILKDLSRLPDAQAAAVHKLSEAKLGDALANKDVLTSPTMPAIERFTGVLFDALGAQSVPWNRLAIGDALFGLVRAGDLIPFYRLSGSTKLPVFRSSKSAPTLKSRWGGAIRQVLEEQPGLVVDLRSGTYQQLGPLPSAVTVRVESLHPDGSRKVISHFNKHYKGVLARQLALCGKDLASIDEVKEVAASIDGFEVDETSSPTEITIVIPTD